MRIVSLVAAVLAVSCAERQVVHRTTEVRETIEVERTDDAAPARPLPAIAPAPREQRSAGVRAGSSDDNLNFDAFARFLRDHGDLGLPHDVEGRSVIEVRDARDLPVFGARVIVRDGRGTVVAQRKTYPDGRTIVFPSQSAWQGSIEVSYRGDVQIVPLGSGTVRVDMNRSEVEGRIPLDVAFVIDTTGSMQDEIDGLRAALGVIHSRLTHLDPAADVRFGLVEYKDRGDDFVTRPIAFTDDVAEFRTRLQRLRAYGGGDEPEDVQAGLEQALHALRWREGAVKVAFLIGDAPPHLDYREQFTYLDAMDEAARRGIKIAAVGCSGLNLQGEVIWREIAQATMAPYVFLARGERGDMEGSASTVSHHVGPNWTQENLDTIVVRVVTGELAPLSPRSLAQTTPD